MRSFRLRRLPTASRFVLLCALTLAFGAGAALAQADATSANLSGFVRDPAGAVVPGATVTARNPATNDVHTAVTNDEGFYQLPKVPPGTYEVSVEAKNFKRAVVPSVTVTVGQRADLDVTLENGRPIGPAPTSGLNFGGQRGRSNLVQVDGADNTDNSVSAARSTVSQEAVQEFQVVTNSYAPEFGRTAGGVVNVVTKSGTNQVRGNVFGFLRHNSFQARNASAPVEKPPFTRAQYGFTLGGPFDKDRTFFFLSFEQRRRHESGFFTSNVSQGLTNS